MDELRFNIINYSTLERTFSVKVSGNNSRVMRMVPDGAISQTGPSIAMAVKDVETPFTVGPSTICGFVAGEDTILIIDNPDENVLVITAAGKNPWPVPPPPPPGPYNNKTYYERFRTFNTGEADGKPASATIRYVVLSGASARAGASSDKDKTSP